MVTRFIFVPANGFCKSRPLFLYAAMALWENNAAAIRMTPFNVVRTLFASLVFLGGIDLEARFFGTSFP